MTPVLIVTRPEPKGAEFAAAIRREWTGPLDVILSPLLEIVPLTQDHDLSGLGGVIFTSTNGVAQAGRLGVPLGLPAYCVGERTAAAASAAGFAAKTGAGDVEQLAAMILRQDPTGTLAHIRGRHARGNLAERLTDAGLPCLDVIAYDQRALPLSPDAEKALQGQNPAVVPLFSARTCTIFEQAGRFAAPVHLVAISAATMPRVLTVATCSVAARPDGDAMRDATIGCLRNVTHGGG